MMPVFFSLKEKNESEGEILSRLRENETQEEEKKEKKEFEEKKTRRK